MYEKINKIVFQQIEDTAQHITTICNVCNLKYVYKTYNKSTFTQYFKLFRISIDKLVDL